MADNDVNNAGNGAATGDEQPQQQFGIQKLYLLDASLECPGAPDVFRENWQPEANVELGTRSRAIDEEHGYEVVVTVTVTAKQGEKTAYLCEVQQAGVFGITGVDDATLDRLLGAYCPSVLFAYAREALSDLTTKAGFPPMTLAPVNFEALYAQRQAQRESGETPDS